LRVPAFVASIAAEAEWEYACRSGREIRPGEFSLSIPRRHAAQNAPGLPTESAVRRRHRSASSARRKSMGL